MLSLPCRVAILNKDLCSLLLTVTKDNNLLDKVSLLSIINFAANCIKSSFTESHLYR